MWINSFIILNVDITLHFEKLNVVRLTVHNKNVKLMFYTYVPAAR